MIKKCRSFFGSLLFLVFSIVLIGCENDDYDFNSHKQVSQGGQFNRAPQNMILNPVADSYVNSGNKSKNYGTRSELLVDSSPRVYRTFLKFSVPSISGQIQSAKLRLYVFDATSNGPEFYLTSNSWTETGIKWNNQPDQTGSKLADLGSVSTGWIELDVTSTVTTSGDVSFVILPDSSNGIDFYSREASNKPELIITTDDGGTGSDVNCTLNPYASVNWSTWGQYKANYHTHTTNSDGSQTPSQVIDEYYNADYSILAITDHNATTWSWTDYGRNPGSLNMIAVKGNEYSNSHHMNAFFNFTASSNNLENGIPHVDYNEGLSHINHPGRYNSPSDWGWYVTWYQDYLSCIGLEVFNQGDRYSNDRKLWDNINENFFQTDGKLVWGFSNDDKHSTSHLYKNYQYMIMPDLTEADLKNSMKNGSFYFCYEPGGSGNGNVPRITSIIVNNSTKTITINATGYNNITWIGPGSQTVGTGNTFNFSNYINKPFVRALLDGSNGDSYTQPFGFLTSN